MPAEVGGVHRETLDETRVSGDLVFGGPGIRERLERPFESRRLATSIHVAEGYRVGRFAGEKGARREDDRRHSPVLRERGCHGGAVELQGDVGGRPCRLAVDMSDRYARGRRDVLGLGCRSLGQEYAFRRNRHVHCGREEPARNWLQQGRWSRVRRLPPGGLAIVSATAFFVDEADEVIRAGLQRDGSQGGLPDSSTVVVPSGDARIRL